MPKPRGKVDRRSFKHASINAGAAGTVLTSGVAVDQIIDAYAKLDKAGLMPDHDIVLRVVETSLSELLPWIAVLGILVGGVTLIVKALVEYQ